ncbi:hypothetical protein [Streptosporangium carneum]|uniref:Uncharacterized protein n=1 Tax=Streptosporangium carneum TaxID=47481 RepID=A0A9W6IC27_9ACTN|nr:hypothetical protein [Streptosporangium carneum]GLK14839.1 hypothetical protein GCM10017600_82510 [Streptosporangium carneum]
MRGLKAAAVLAAVSALVFPAQAQAETGSAAGPAGVAGQRQPHTAAKPSTVAVKLFRAWQRDDRVAASAVATPAAVNTLFAYPYRAPDRFGGCTGNACRFVHTSVRVPGGLNGVLMIVSGAKVTKVYESRHVTVADKAAKYLFDAWKAGDRNRGLEIASAKAVGTLFRSRYGGVGYIFQGCETERGGKRCAYSYEGGAMFMHARRHSAGGGHWIESISYIAD